MRTLLALSLVGLGFAANLPAPHDDAYQTITNLRVDARYRYEIATGAEDNRILHIRVTDPKEPAIAVAMRFDAVRKEHLQPLPAVSPANAAEPPSPPDLDRYLRPDRLVPSTTLSGVGRARWWTRRAPRPIWKWRGLFTIMWWPP